MARTLHYLSLAVCILSLSAASEVVKLSLDDQVEHVGPLRDAKRNCQADAVSILILRREREREREREGERDSPATCKGGGGKRKEERERENKTGLLSSKHHHAKASHLESSQSTVTIRLATTFSTSSTLLPSQSPLSMALLPLFTVLQEMICTA